MYDINTYSLGDSAEAHRLGNEETRKPQHNDTFWTYCDPIIVSITFDPNGGEIRHVIRNVDINDGTVTEIYSYRTDPKNYNLMPGQRMDIATNYNPPLLKIR